METNLHPNGLHRLRKRKNLTLKGIAERTGIPYSQLARFERHNIGLGKSRINDVAALLEVEPWELYVPVEVEQKNLPSE